MANGSRMFSSADNVGNKLNCWNTNPTLSRRNVVNPLSDNPVNPVSPMWTSPRVTVSKPARQCINVDFPDPDGPIIAVNRPRSSSTEMPRKAITCASPVP